MIVLIREKCNRKLEKNNRFFFYFIEVDNLERIVYGC